MRKIIIILLILIACVFCFFLYSYGVAGISSMAVLQDLKEEYDTKAANVEQQKENYDNTKDNLRIALASYTTSKEQYEQTAKYTSVEVQEQAALGDYYDLEYLWTIIGTHAIREDVELGLVCTTSATPAENDDFIYADLNFTVEGEYRPISDFIERCEDDESLQFSISHFKLVPYTPKDAEEEETKANYLVATFIVQDVPLSLETLELIDNQLEDSPEAQGTLSGDLEDEAEDAAEEADSSNETNSTSEESDESEKSTNETSDNSSNTTSTENTTDGEIR